MPNPQLSVIIPVYNAQDYIANTLSVLLKQAFQDFEVICVNDCSPDGSLEILRRFEQEDPRVRCIDLAQNQGPGKARNHAIDVARGTYITFLDADDEIDGDLYAKAMALALETDADQVVWGATEEHYDAKNCHVKSVPILPEKQLCTTQPQIVSAAIGLEERTLFGYIWNSLYRNSLIQAHHIRLRDALLYEDYFFNLDFIRHTRTLAVLDHVGYHYFKRVNTSVTHRFNSNYYDLSYERVDSFRQYCQESGMMAEQAVRMLGNKLLRYTLSALARNNDPRAGMDGGARKQWIEQELYTRPLYSGLLQEKFETNPVFAVLRLAISRKWAWLCLLMGKLVYWMRRG